jgi:hypothetical protein
MKSISKVLEQTKGIKRPTNLYKEFQQFGVYLAEQLEDTKHYSLYIKLAKDTKREILLEALSFTKGYLSAKNKGKVFMWKLKQLKQALNPS